MNTKVNKQVRAITLLLRELDTFLSPIAHLPPHQLSIEFPEPLSASLGELRENLEDGLAADTSIDDMIQLIVDSGVNTGMLESSEAFWERVRDEY